MKISNLLRSENIFLGKNLQSKKSVLQTLSLELSLTTKSVTESYVLERLLARERLGTTGLGGGIAIPHARIDIIKDPLAVFLRTMTPVSFDALDEKPVDLFFAICIPEGENDQYLDFIAILAETFQDNSCLRDLRLAASEKQILDTLSSRMVTNCE